MIYCCFDTAINGDYSLFRLKNEYEEQCCLFEGTADEKLQDVAPWLFKTDSSILDLGENDELIELNHLVFFETGTSIKELNDHLQNFIYYTASETESWFFRFWDARVMSSYLTTSEKKQLIDFFEHTIEHIYCINSDDGFKRFAINSSGNLIISDANIEAVLSSQKAI